MSNPYINDNVFIIIPVFNETGIINSVVRELCVCGLQIVIIDDGSSKNILQEVEEFNMVHFIRHKVNLGQGAALQTGIDYSLGQGANYIITFDGDGQHSPKDLSAILTPLQNGEADITLASRFLKKGLHNASVIRQLILKTGCVLNYFLTGLYLSDAHNGLRGMTKKTAQIIKLKENRMAHATEFLFAIRRYHLKYLEVPARIVYSPYSKTKGQSLFNSIRIAFDLVLHKLFE